QLSNPQVATATPPRTAGLRYSYYVREGQAISDVRHESLDAMKPKPEGKVAKVGINIPKRADDGFALKLTGIIEVPRAGKYTFRVASDDGSRVYLDGQLLIENDGVHGVTEKSASV